MEGLLKDALLQVLRYFHNPELIGSLLLLYVIHVVGFTVNIPHLFLNGLKFIVAPTEDAVLRIRSDARGPRPEPLGQLDKEGKEANAYDKMNALGLARMEISRGTLGTLMFFPDYEGMVIWSLVALGNFLIAQASRCAFPTQSPLGWASLTIVAALLRAWWCNVRLMYLLGVGNDHAKFAVLCGFCGLFAAAAVAAAGLSPSANLFAFDLRAAAISLYAWGKGFAAAVFGWGGGGGISEEDFVAAFFLPTVAVAAACATAAAALPAIRFAQYFNRGLGRDSGASFLHRALLVADAVLPWLATLSWITAFQYLINGNGQTREGEGGGKLALVRIGVTGLAAAARLAVGRLQLQAYLEGVKQSVLKELREKKVDPQAVRLKFDARFQYLMIAAAQYAAPALTVVLSVVLLVHVGGGGNGSGSGSTAVPVGDPTAAAFPGDALSAGGVGLGVCDAARRAVGLQPWDTVLAAAAAASGGSGVVGGLEPGVVIGQQGGLAGLAARIPGSPHRAFLSGVSGFLAWWACLSWAVTYAIGVGFWWLFPEDESAVERSRADTTTKGKKEKVKGKAKAKGGGGRGAAGAGGKS